MSALTDMMREQARKSRDLVAESRKEIKTKKVAKCTHWRGERLGPGPDRTDRRIQCCDCGQIFASEESFKEAQKEWNK